LICTNVSRQIVLRTIGFHRKWSVPLFQTRDAKRIRLQENKNKETRIKQAAEARRKMVEGILSLRFDEEQSYAQIAAKYKIIPR
jgi:5-hydroxyisourate hydrolase-like protein (transthyretin family)